MELQFARIENLFEFSLSVAVAAKPLMVHGLEAIPRLTRKTPTHDEQFTNLLEVIDSKVSLVMTRMNLNFEDSVILMHCSLTLDP